MGRRSRKRAAGPVITRPAADAAPPAAPRAPGRRPTIDERPKPPWHPVPLVELSVLAGLVLIIYGFLNAGDRQGRVCLVFGLVLASLGGLDTALREHFSGYRSHTMLLAGLPAVAAAAALFFVKAPWIVMVAGAAVVFGIVFWLARGAFRKRAGVPFRA